MTNNELLMVGDKTITATVLYDCMITVYAKRLLDPGINLFDIINKYLDEENEIVSRAGGFCPCG